MKWTTSLFVIGTVLSLSHSMATQDAHAPSSDKTYHFPTASLTIAGDLKDVKLKGTIAQLVRALQQPNSTKEEPVTEPATKPKTAKKKIHPSQLITKHNINKQGHKNGKKLYYGEALPEAIQVSSQSVKVKPAGKVNNTGANRAARHLSAYIGNNPSAVRTVEGVRVPDDEHDKHYTWRNARVIKGFLVPNDRPANPHKKRQVIITDPQQYLAAAAAAQAQGATTIIDTSALHQRQQHQAQQRSNNHNNPQASVFYAQEPAGGLAGGPSQNERSHHNHPQVNYPNQHQQHHQAANNGQTSGYSYAQPNSNMYVVQDGFANNLKYSNQNQAQSLHLQQQQHHQQAQLAQQQAQAQFFSRSGEAPIAPASPSSQSSSSINSATSSAVNPQQQQRGSENSAQSLSAAIKQQQYQPSLDTQAIQAAVEAVQQLEAQQSAQQHQQHQQIQQQQHSQQQLSISGITLDQQQGSPAIQQATQQQIAALLAQQSAPSQSIVLPQGIGGATAQEILAATQAATNNGQLTAQYIQLQPSQEQPIQLTLQQQQLQAQAAAQQQQQFPAPDQFSERQQYPGGGAAYPASASQFVIQPQTYLAGAGGQTFTVPIPVPVEQAVAQQQQQQQQVAQQFQQQQQQLQQQQHFQQQQQQQSRQHSQFNHQHHQQQQPYNQIRQYQPGQNPNQSSLTDRMKQAFNQNFNRKMLERVETNAVVPALASTGLFLGLSALAAGWYLSKSNREVGIVRRTGKFSKKKGNLPSPNIIPTLNSGGDISSADEKDGSASSRKRRDLASMVTPQGYTPNGAPEVDQATFFQSIIQQSLEKTQKEYDDPADQSAYQQDGSYHQMDNQQGPVYHRQEQQQMEPERQGPPGPPGPPRYRPGSRFNRYNDRPASKFSRDDDFNDSPANSRISKSQPIQEKSGWSVHSAKNFARVAIPAVVLTGAALGICAVIFGWYISGDNREIAFLESPTTNSIGQGQGGWSARGRTKRSLFSSSSPSAPAWSDGWLIRTLKAIHGNPYDSMPAPTAKSFVPYPYFLDKDSSKTSTMEFKVSNNGLASVLAGGAVLAVVALGLINSFAESSARNLKTARYNHLLTPGASASLTKHSSTNPLTHLRSPRNYFENNLEFQELASKPSFFEQILAGVNGKENGLFNKLQEMSASSTWQKSSCIKSLLCRSISSQGDDTVGLMEKRMATVMKMLPDSVSSSITKNFSDVLAAIYRRDCSTFTCASHAHSDKKKEELTVVVATPVVQQKSRPMKRASSHKKKAKSSIKNNQQTVKSKSS